MNIKFEGFWGKINFCGRLGFFFAGIWQVADWGLILIKMWVNS